MLAIPERRAAPSLPAALLAGALFTVGCAAPIPVPVARVAPAVALPEAPPAAGKARLVLDVEEGRADVYREVTRDGRRSYTARWQETDIIADARTAFVCTTPCVVDLPAGGEGLYFRGAEDRKRQYERLVQLPEGRTTNLRVRLGRKAETVAAYDAGGYAVIGGAGVAAVGAVVFGIARLGLAASSSAGPHAHGVEYAGLGIGAGGLALVGLGIALLVTHPPLGRMGNSVQW
jgi:hypothetical protein